MFRRLGSAVLMAGIGLAGLATGTAAAASSCADYHWIGAAGSGQRDAAGLTANGGMGDVVYQSYQQLRDDLAAGGQTIDAEAVQYPAAPVPLKGGLSGWLGFLGSVGDGTDAVAQQVKTFTERCPDTKLVLAGYSQGAMIVHRNLYKLADNPQVVAALLIADGDRLPGDNTINLGSATGGQDRGKGVAQEHSLLASANTAPLPPAIGARTVSVCDAGDPVCDYDPDTKVTDAAVAIHTSYAPVACSAHDWVSPLYTLVTSGARTPASTIALTAR